jgi:hypothetical protein
LSSVGQSVKLLLAFASTVIPGFILHEQDFCSSLGMYVTRKGACFSTREDANHKDKVTLRLAVYRQSVRLDVNLLEDHDQSFFFATEPFR